MSFVINPLANPDEVRRGANSFPEMLSGFQDQFLARFHAQGEKNDPKLSADADDVVRSTTMIRGALSAIERLTPWAGNIVIPLLREVAAYFDNSVARKKIDSMLLEHLTRARNSSEKIILVSHSLGTIISYCVLHELSKSVRWPPIHWITLGSPLGVHAVQKRLRKICHLDRVWPGVVSSWMNASDPRDITALAPRLDRESFFTSGKSRRFDIVNFSDLKNNTSNRHGIEGYLSDPVAALWILSSGFK